LGASLRTGEGEERKKGSFDISWPETAETLIPAQEKAVSSEDRGKAAFKSFRPEREEKEKDASRSSVIDRIRGESGPFL